uniref:Uncharacterized protein n=1 Tax=viral metagenome TaxID=1070528 RepID=A0A6M3KFB5_9ZZZZ
MIPKIIYKAFKQDDAGAIIAEMTIILEQNDNDSLGNMLAEIQKEIKNHTLL